MSNYHVKLSCQNIVSNYRVKLSCQTIVSNYRVKLSCQTIVSNYHVSDDGSQLRISNDIYTYGLNTDQEAISTALRYWSTRILPTTDLMCLFVIIIINICSLIEKEVNIVII